MVNPKVVRKMNDYNRMTMMVQDRLSLEISDTLRYFPGVWTDGSFHQQPSPVQPGITGAPDEQRIKKYPIR